MRSTRSVRPKSLSHCWSCRRRVSGVSPARGSKRTTALRNSGEPGGQSTGVEDHSDEARKPAPALWRRRAQALRRIWARSPRFEPNETTTPRPVTCGVEGGAVGPESLTVRGTAAPAGYRRAGWPRSVPGPARGFGCPRAGLVRSDHRASLHPLPGKPRAKVRRELP